MERKTSGQRFLRKSRALTLTISIPSLSISSSFKNKESSKRSESVISLKRSQSSRDVWRHKLSASENCLDREEEVKSDLGGCISVINISSENNNQRRDNHAAGDDDSEAINKFSDSPAAGSGFGYKLKRSLTVSHILDNINKSFRVRRSASQRELAAKKNRLRR